MHHEIDGEGPKVRRLGSFSKTEFCKQLLVFLSIASPFQRGTLRDHEKDGGEMDCDLRVLFVADHNLLCHGREIGFLETPPKAAHITVETDRVSELLREASLRPR
jgi:hypothetical protein